MQLGIQLSFNQKSLILTRADIEPKFRFEINSNQIIFMHIRTETFGSETEF